MLVLLLIVSSFDPAFTFDISFNPSSVSCSYSLNCIFKFPGLSISPISITCFASLVSPPFVYFIVTVFGFSYNLCFSDGIT